METVLVILALVAGSCWFSRRVATQRPVFRKSIGLRYDDGAARFVRRLPFSALAVGEGAQIGHVRSGQRGGRRVWVFELGVAYDRGGREVQQDFTGVLVEVPAAFPATVVAAGAVPLTATEPVPVHCTRVDELVRSEPDLALVELIGSHVLVLVHKPRGRNLARSLEVADLVLARIPDWAYTKFPDAYEAKPVTREAPQEPRGEFRRGERSGGAA